MFVAAKTHGFREIEARLKLELKKWLFISANTFSSALHNLVPKSCSLTKAKALKGEIMP